MVGEVFRYIEKKKWIYQKENLQYKIKICPLCGAYGYKFYINSITGQYICWICNESGNLYSLKKELGDSFKVLEPFLELSDTNKKIKKYLRLSTLYNKNLINSLEVRRLLYDKWRYTLKDIIVFKIGLFTDDKNVSWVSIPYFDTSGFTNIKFRTIPGLEKKFKRIKGMKSSLFNVQKLNFSLNYVYLLEGESDCITASTKLFLKNSVGVTVGARGFLPHWKDIIDKFENIYIIYDPDIVGQDGSYKLARRLGVGRCKNILLPNKVKDLTEWYKNGGNYEEYKKLEKKAKLIDIENVISFQKILQEVKERLFLTKVLDDGFTTPWKGVNKLIGTMSKGDLIVVSGKEKVGKSTFALNIILDFSFNSGIPSLYYCLEMRPDRIVTKIISNLRLVSSTQITPDDISVIESRCQNKPFYMGYSYNFTVDKVFETIRDSVLRYGIEVIVFDHLHFLVRSISNVSAEVGNIVRRFKLIAEELGILIILIAQPRKLQGSKVRMSVSDLRDSSSIGQDGDTIIILHREKLDFKKKVSSLNKPISVFSDVSEVIVEATRYNPGGVSSLKFNGEYSRYFNDREDEKRTILKRGSRNG